MKCRKLILLILAWTLSSSGLAVSADDQLAIEQLMQRWGLSRDQGRWEDLAGTFHPEGTISVTWYAGDFSGFVEASKEMAKGSTKSKHLIGTPLIEISGDKALSETNITIMGRAEKGPLTLDVTSFARFFDRLEKRNGEWKLLERTAIYEKDRLDSVQPSFLFWLSSLFLDFDQYPEAYRYLAYGLVEGGYELVPGIIVDKSAEADRLYLEGKAWLQSEPE